MDKNVVPVVALFNIPIIASKKFDDNLLWNTGRGHSMGPREAVEKKQPTSFATNNIIFLLFI